MSASDDSDEVEIVDHLYKETGNDPEEDDEEEEENLSTLATNELGGVFAPLIKRRREKEAKECSVDPLPQWTIGSNIDQFNNQNTSSTCNCQYDNCLKVRGGGKLLPSPFGFFLLLLCRVTFPSFRNVF